MRHYSYRTEKAYVHWIKRCIFFHNKRHPQEMAESEIAAFLSSLASADHVSAATQNQALNALLFLYNEVLKKKIGMVQGVVRAKRPRRLPVVLTKDEVKKILGNLTGTSWLMAIILYRTGLRLMECCRLRIKDVDFSRNQIIVRSGKGDKDRYTMLPTAVREPLLRHLQMLEGGYDIRTVQELLGHKDVSTTMIYTRVLNRGGSGVVSPVDSLLK
jgi:site-specific recombinase XerD